MICGLVGVPFFVVLVPSIVALVLGLVAAHRIKSSGGVLHGLAVARIGWITGVIGVVGGVAFVTAAVMGAFDEDTAVFDLEVGDCVRLDPDLADDAEVGSVPVVGCDEPHNGEVFLVGELNPDRDRVYPTEDELFDEVVGECLGPRIGAASPFDDYVGAPLETSDLDVYWIAPIERVWDATRGQFVCIAGPLDLRDSLGSSVRADGERPSSPPGDGAEVSVFDLQVGDCVHFDVVPELVNVRTVPVVGCDEPHNAEVFFAGELNPGGDRDYPASDDALFDEVEEQCLAPRSGGVSPFEDYIGVGYDVSELYAYPIVADRLSWTRLGGPFLCLAVPGDPEELLTESVAGSGR